MKKSDAVRPAWLSAHHYCNIRRMNISGVNDCKQQRVNNCVARREDNCYTEINSFTVKVFCSRRRTAMAGE
jgi:hypothetical protein